MIDGCADDRGRVDYLAVVGRNVDDVGIGRGDCDRVVHLLDRLRLIVDEVAVLLCRRPQPLDRGEYVVGLGDHGLAGLFRPVDVVAHPGHQVREAGGEFADAVTPRLVDGLRRAFLVRESR